MRSKIKNFLQAVSLSVYIIIIVEILLKKHILDNLINYEIYTAQLQVLMTGKQKGGGVMIVIVEQVCFD